MRWRFCVLQAPGYHSNGAHGRAREAVCLVVGEAIGADRQSDDEEDRLLKVNGSRAVGYRYDLDGNRRALLYWQEAAPVTYTFDKADRLGSFQDWAGRTTSYQYFPDGSLKQVTNVNGTTATYSYDNALRLTDVLTQLGSNTLSRHTYTLDAVGNRTQVNELLPQLGFVGTTTPSQTSYGYDTLYRLTSVTGPSGTTSYRYDPVGNRLTRTRGDTLSYSYDRADRITAAGEITDTVNANGNLTARGSDSFLYDQANRLISATVGGTTTTATYDGDGKRVSTTVGGVTTTYMYDVNTSLPVVLEDGHFTYFYGLGLTYAVDQSNGLVRVFHADGLGSVRAITNLDDRISVIETYQTDAFGVPTQTQGGVSQPFQFTGQQRDAESGLYYLRARMYDPTTGRFIAGRYVSTVRGRRNATSFDLGQTSTKHTGCRHEPPESARHGSIELPWRYRIEEQDVPLRPSTFLASPRRVIPRSGRSGDPDGSTGSTRSRASGLYCRLAWGESWCRRR